MKTTEATTAIQFTCGYCENVQCVEDTLVEDEIDGAAVRTAIVDCPSCSHEIKLVMPITTQDDDAESADGC